jgi:hypothetical protein
VRKGVSEKRGVASTTLDDASSVSYRNFAEASFGPSIISEREGFMPGPRMPGRNFLFVPGPTNVPDRVMRAMMVAMEDHRSPKFPELTMSLFHELKKVFKTEAGQPFIFSGSGTGAWEAALTNTLSPGDKVLAPRFGRRLHSPTAADSCRTSVSVQMRLTR